VKKFALPTLGALLTGLTSMIAVPLQVSVDGYFYLSSAKSLFTEDRDRFYAFVREPGYPLVLRFIHDVLGSADVWLGLAQGFMLGFAVFFIGFLILPPRRNLRTVVLFIALYLAAINPVFFAYSGYVLQQPWQAFLMAAWFVLMWLALMRPTLGSALGALAGGIILAVVSAWSSIALSYLQYLGLTVLVACVLWRAWGALQRRRVERALAAAPALGLSQISPSVAGTRRQQVAIAVVLLLSLVGAGVIGMTATRSTEGWYAAGQAAVSEGRNELQPAAQITPQEAIGYNLAAPWLLMRRLPTLVFGVGAVTMLGPTVSADRVQENVVFSRISVNPQWICGAYHDFTFYPYTDYARGWFTQTCRDRWAQAILADYAPWGAWLYRLASIALLTVWVPLLILRRWRDLLLLLPAYGFLAAYVSVNFLIDRYGVPLYPFGIGAILLWAKVIDTSVVLPLAIRRAWAHPSIATLRFARARGAREIDLPVVPGTLIDAEWYRRHNDVDPATPVLQHYLEVGSPAGRSPHPLFDEEWYRRLNPGIPEGVSALAHYVDTGLRDLRSPHPLFDEEWYRGTVEGIPADVTGLQHYLEVGTHAGRSPHPLFDEPWYRERTAVPESMSALEHYLSAPLAERGSPHPLIDEQWYHALYLDVPPETTALRHYIEYGAREGRSTHPAVDEQAIIRMVGF